MSTQQPEPQASASQREVELQQVQDALRGLRYGTVSIIVQDGVVVQIDRTEKRRLRQGSTISSDPGATR
jgi:hypothetical protein